MSEAVCNVSHGDAETMANPTPKPTTAGERRAKLEEVRKLLDFRSDVVPGKLVRAHVSRLGLVVRLQDDLPF